MTNLIRSFLAGRRAELMDLISPLREEIEQKKAELSGLENELAEVDKAASAIGMVNGLLPESEPGPSTKSGTIKDFAVRVLRDYPDGLVALDILFEINSRFGTDFKRTSLSPQLSRLKKEGVIARRGVVWRLVHENEKDPDADASGPLSNAGDVAERSIASDSKSDEGYPAKDAQPSVGSNPTVSAPSHRSRDLFLTGTSISGASANLKTPPWERKGG